MRKSQKNYSSAIVIGCVLLMLCTVVSILAAGFASLGSYISKIAYKSEKEQVLVEWGGGYG